MIKDGNDRPLELQEGLGFFKEKQKEKKVNKDFCLSIAAIFTLKPHNCFKCSIIMGDKEINSWTQIQATIKIST